MGEQRARDLNLSLCASNLAICNEIRCLDMALVILISLLPASLQLMQRVSNPAEHGVLCVFVSEMSTRSSFSQTLCFEMATGGMIYDQVAMTLLNDINLPALRHFFENEFRIDKPTISQNVSAFDSR